MKHFWGLIFLGFRVRYSVFFLLYQLELNAAIIALRRRALYLFFSVYIFNHARNQA